MTSISKPLTCERKFVSDRADYSTVVAMLQSFCMPDGMYPEGILESVYYDDASLSSYWEKANGDALKRKVRIRWYHGTEKDGQIKAFLEIKDRIGAARDKVRFEFTADADKLTSAPLTDPYFIDLLTEQSKIAGFAIPQGLLPTVSIRYNRYRFVCPQTNSRISVDYSICCPRVNQDIFPMPVPLSTGMVVCEAKSHVFKSWSFGDMLSRMGFRMESFSKYGYLVGRLLQGGFK